MNQDPNRPKSRLPCGIQNPDYVRWLAKHGRIMPERRQYTSGIKAENEYMMGLASEVGRACDKWLADRGLESEAYGPILANHKNRGIK